MCRCPKVLSVTNEFTRRGRAFFKQTCANFYPQNSCNGVIQTRLGNGSGVYLLQSVGIEFFPVGVRRHKHIQPSVDSLWAADFGAAWNKFMTTPVAHHETIKTQLLF